MHRRDFLGGLAAALVAARAHPARRLERIGVQLYTVRGALARDFEGTLAAVARIGFAEVEFAGYFDRSPRDVRAVIERNGLSAPAAHIAAVEGAAWQAALDAARTIGHRWLVVPWIPPDRRTGDGYRRLADEFNRAGAEARAAGLAFAYHNQDYDFAPLAGATGYDVLLARTDPALVDLELDLYWITRGGGDPLAYFARWPGRFPLVHVKDSAGPPDHRMVDVGRGTIPFGALFAHAERAGIRHWFVEHDDPADPLASIRAGLAYLKRLAW